jgi:hypothetical protein
MTEEMPKVKPFIAIYMGRFWSGMISTIMTVAPEKMPADPIPAIARPMMKTTELGAAPETADPISKTITADIEANLVLYSEKIFPHSNCVAQLLMRYAPAYQETSSRE